ncbi:MAG: glycosyltransferase family 4 protein [Pseudomonadota bacterium]
MMIVNDPAFFLSHRLVVARAALDAGYRVVIATSAGQAVGRITEAGLEHRPIELSRSGTNPLKEFRTLLDISRLIGSVRPDVLHLVTIKPVIYGGIAARLNRVPALVSAISGLGFLYGTGASWKTRILRALLKPMYRFALRHRNGTIIVQNDEDARQIRRLSGRNEDHIVQLKGSGVDLDRFTGSSEPPRPIVALMAARMLAEKGVYTFVDAARRLTTQRRNVVCRLIGSPDPGNPGSVTTEELEAWQQDGIIEWQPYTADMPSAFARCHLFVLPSYYGEGLPKVLLEAAASRRAVITTDHPGCRDAIIAGKTGLLVPPRDSTALADAILELASDGARRRLMGGAGYALAHSQFADSAIANAHLDVYESLHARSQRTK